MRRAFNKSEKQILFLLADGKCQLCGEPLGRGWHADHIIPYSKGGLTEVRNGQALCSKCNLTKSNNMKHKFPSFELREWQKKCLSEMDSYFSRGITDFMLVAGVGSGKTLTAQWQAVKMLERKEIDVIYLIAPTVNVLLRWQQDFKKLFNVDATNNTQDCLYKLGPYKDYQVAAITFQGLTEGNNKNILQAQRTQRFRALLIADEIHHSGNGKPWAETLKPIGLESKYRLMMSGTPYRSDDNQIPFVHYERQGDQKVLKPDFNYSYIDSVKDNYCTQVLFKRYESGYLDNPKQWMNHINDQFEDYNVKRIICNTSSWFDYVFTDADKKLQDIQSNRDLLISELRAKRYNKDVIDTIEKNVGGLVICVSKDHARSVYEYIKEKKGSDYVDLIISNDEDDEEKSDNQAAIEAFKKSSTKKWVVSVKLISEGTDIPRIRSIIYASNVASPLSFTQIMGRGVRNKIHIKGVQYDDKCIMYIPDYKPIVEIADKIEQDLIHAIGQDYIDNIKDDSQKEPKVQERQEITSYLIDQDTDFSGANIGGRQITKEEYMILDAYCEAKNYQFEMILAQYADGALNLENIRHYYKDEPNLQEEPILKKDKEKRLRVKINKVAAKIAHKVLGVNSSSVISQDILREEMKDIHIRYNKLVGVENQKNFSIDQLEMKLSFLNETLKNLQEQNV